MYIVIAQYIIAFTMSKTCKTCFKDKQFTDFYKAGNKYQSACKPCHNAKRAQYKNNKKYTRRATGFSKLTPETQAGIIKDISNKVSLPTIANNYKDEPNFPSYQTLNVWKKNGQIII